MKHSAEEMAHASSEPAVSSNSLICEFSTWRGAARVILDSEAGLVHFGNCHRTRKFFARPSGWYSCRISDLKAVHCFDGNLTASTAIGIAWIPASATCYDELRKYLMEAAPANQPEFSTDNPITLFAYIGSLLLGIDLGIFLMPPDYGSEWMNVAHVVGSFSGWLPCYILFLLSGRFLKIDLAQPLGNGFRWALCFTPFGFLSGNPGRITIALVGALGVIDGVRKRRK